MKPPQDTFIEVFDENGCLNETFRREFYDQTFREFSEKLTEQRIRQDEERSKENPNEFTTVNSDIRLEEATILVDHLSAEVADFIEITKTHRRILDTFGFIRLRARKLKWATAKEEEVFLVEFKENQHLQYCKPVEETGKELLIIVNDPEKVPRTRTVGALFKRNQEIVTKFADRIDLKTDQGHFKLLQAAKGIEYVINETGMESRTEFFRFSHLQRDPRNVLSTLKHHSVGISTPSYNSGVKSSCFPLHTEDCDLYSANQCVFGDPKVWFIFNAAQYEEIIAFSKELHEKAFDPCSNPLRHKHSFITMEAFNRKKIPFTRIEQEPGDTIVLDAKAFHCGYNSGLNLNQAINFMPVDEFRNGEFLSSSIDCDCGHENVKFNEDFTGFNEVQWDMKKQMWLPAKKSKKSKRRIM